jgi:hypothetical protein
VQALTNMHAVFPGTFKSLQSPGIKSWGKYNVFSYIFATLFQTTFSQYKHNTNWFYHTLFTFGVKHT